MAECHSDTWHTWPPDDLEVLIRSADITIPHSFKSLFAVSLCLCFAHKQGSEPILEN